MRITIADSPHAGKRPVIDVACRELSTRLEGLPTDRLELLRDTLDRYGHTFAGEGAVRVLETAVAELAARSGPCCRHCAGLGGELHASWCPRGPAKPTPSRSLRPELHASWCPRVAAEGDAA